MSEKVLGFVIKFKWCVSYFFFLIEFRPESAVSAISTVSLILVRRMRVRLLWRRVRASQVPSLLRFVSLKCACQFEDHRYDIHCIGHF